MLRPNSLSTSPAIFFPSSARAYSSCSVALTAGSPHGPLKLTVAASHPYRCHDTVITVSINIVCIQVINLLALFIALKAHSSDCPSSWTGSGEQKSLRFQHKPTRVLQRSVTNTSLLCDPRVCLCFSLMMTLSTQTSVTKPRRIIEEPVAGGTL